MPDMLSWLLALFVVVVTIIGCALALLISMGYLFLTWLFRSSLQFRRKNRD